MPSIVDMLFPSRRRCVRILKAAEVLGYLAHTILDASRRSSLGAKRAHGGQISDAVARDIEFDQVGTALNALQRGEPSVREIEPPSTSSRSYAPEIFISMLSVISAMCAMQRRGGGRAPSQAYAPRLGVLCHPAPALMPAVDAVSAAAGVSPVPLSCRRPRAGTRGHSSAGCSEVPTRPRAGAGKTVS